MPNQSKAMMKASLENFCARVLRYLVLCWVEVEPLFGERHELDARHEFEDGV